MTVKDSEITPWSQPPVENRWYTRRRDGTLAKVAVEFTPELKDLFLEWYRRTGVIYLSAQAVGVSGDTVKRHAKEDEVFGELLREAKEQHTDLLVQEAQRRAYQGVSKPIIGGKDRNEVVAHVQEYSDRLMELLLRSRREEYRGKEPVESNERGGVMVVPSSPVSADDWEKEQGAAAKGEGTQE